MVRDNGGGSLDSEAIGASRSVDVYPDCAMVLL